MRARVFFCKSHRGYSQRFRCVMLQEIGVVEDEGTLLLQDAFALLRRLDVDVRSMSRKEFSFYCYALARPTTRARTATTATTRTS